MKKSTKIFIIILVIIVTFSLGTIGGYLLFKGKYDKEINNTFKENNTINKDAKDEINTIQEENLSLSDSTVKDLFNRKTNFHTTSKVTYNTLSDQAKLRTDLSGLTRKSFNNSNYQDVCAKLKNSGNSIMINAYEYCMSMENQSESYDAIVGYYDLEEVRKNNLKFFNESNNLPKKYGYVNTVSLEVNDTCGQVILTDNTYLSYDSYCGYGGLNPLTKNTLVKAVKHGDELYLYDNFIVGTLDDTGDNYVTYNFYSDDDVSNKVTSYRFNETDSGEYNIEINDILKYMQTFKHTYKLNNNGNYYWVSSEPVNSI